MFVQYDFLNYCKKYSRDNQTHIWLGGSFNKGNATEYSDIDLYMRTNDISILKNFIYGYSCEPVYIGHTQRPMGILIVIYENGVALDLSVIHTEFKNTDNFFHTGNYNKSDFVLNGDIYKNIVIDCSRDYSVSRLFHRSIIKYLSGKHRSGEDILKEICEFLSYGYCDTKSYKENFDIIFTEFSTHHNFPHRLKPEIDRLYNCI